MMYYAMMYYAIIITVHMHMHMQRAVKVKRQVWRGLSKKGTK